MQKRPRNREAEYRVLDPDGNTIDLSTHGWPLKGVENMLNVHFEDKIGFMKRWSREVMAKIN